MGTDAGGGHFRHSYTKDKRGLVTRLRRIEGQARGLQRRGPLEPATGAEKGVPQGGTTALPRRV